MPEVAKSPEGHLSLDKRELGSINQKDAGQYSFIFAGNKDELIELIKRIAKKLNVVIKENQDLGKERIRLPENWMIIPYTTKEGLDMQILYDIRSVSDDLKRNPTKLNNVVKEAKAEMSDIVLDCMAEQQ